MRAILRPVLGIVVAAAMAGCSHGASSVAPVGGFTNGASSNHAAAPLYAGSVRPDGSAEVCAPARPGFARCLSLIQLGVSPNIGGYGPADLISAYKLPAAPPSAQTVAIVDAFDDPNAEADLGVYRSHFGLPACTTANGCFKKVKPAGTPTDVGWAEEISLDVDMVSAICPSCHILLEEGFSNSFSDLAKAVDKAAAAGANAISNSYGGGEGGFSFESHYKHSGHMITASSGDSGFAGGPQFPADSGHVTAVGGTHLVHATNTRGWKETVWGGAGSGCSAVSPKPSWQHDPLCSMRTIADVAAVADPGTGVIVYDSFGISPGFYIFGGTSVASPIIASVFALAGNSSSLTFGGHVYSHASHLFDVKSGSNGSCGGTYLCTGMKGYDGPTGLGTPNGTGAF